MAVARAEKMPVNLSGVERKNIPDSIQVYRESRAKIRYPEKSEEVNAAANEDASVISRDKRAFGVFDGMGGEFGGQEASNSAREYLANSLNTFPEKQSLEQETQLIHDILIEANKKILREKMGQSEGRNTTASVVRIWQGPGGERKAIVGNVGDSRVYIFRNGTLRQITLDDNWIRMEYPNKKDARAVQDKMNNTVDPVTGLTPKEQELWQKRNELSQWLGKESISPRMHVVDLLPGDQILVCSDGISDNLTDTEMFVILSKNMSGNYAKEITDAASLRSKANHPRAKKDDMTAIVVEIPSLPVRQKEQKEVVPKEEQKNNVEWKKGMLAPVKRSNGNIEYWPIDWIEPDGKKAIVSKSELEGKKRVREVSLHKIPEESLENISRAKSEVQLYYILERLGGIQGSQDFFSSEDMILLLKDFFDDKHIPEDAITNSGGLRQKAIELKESMQKMKAARRKIRSL